MKFGSSSSSRTAIRLVASYLCALVLITGGPKTPTAQASTAALPAINWLAFDGGGSRIGVNSAETTIAPNTVHRLSRVWATLLPDVADGAPAELAHVATPSGTRDLLFVTTRAGSLLAVDATSGAIVWRRDTHGPHFTTSSAALDPSTQRYVYSYGVDGKVHQYEVGTGTEITTSWPVPITLIPTLEKGSASLNVGRGYLYMATSSYPGDMGHYVGHIVAIQLAYTTSTVFNALCSDKHELLVDTPSHSNYCPNAGGGIWGRGGVVIDPVTGNLFAAVGNGSFTANTGGHNYGDSLLELSPDLKKLLDSYTPTNYADLEREDLDLGSAAPLILPRQGRSATPYLLVQVGKDAVLRLLNRSNLSGKRGPNHLGGELQTVSLPGSCAVLTHPLAWNDPSNTTWVFVSTECATFAYKVVTNAHGRTALQFVYQTSKASSPFLANGVLFLQDLDVIVAVKPTNGTVLWKSTQASARGTVHGRHWQSPVIVNAHLYTTDESRHLYAYAIR